MKLALVISAVYGLAAVQLTMPPPGLTYSGTYTVQANDTMASIAASVHRNICALARANRMADIELMPRVGSTILVPDGNATSPNDTSCLLLDKKDEKQNTLPCIYGGPHVYTVVAGDTLARVARKLNLDVAALASSTGPPPSPSSSSQPPVDVDTPLSLGRGLKIPQCSPSTCQVQPFRFMYGTYVDLALAYNTTVGQIVAFNPTYSFSAATDENKAPVITLPSNCGPTGSGADIVVIS
ncbi:hypothetical protein SBRCBS47491_003755 [Sporothrix bragantina]|uniref:LysM domain-containing protein n=1 Tax=Sporothrix bragantina TaxID=671064 RepID=A0ABP0BJA4_9PEZI